MFASIIYQRRTGPTYPLRGSFTFNETTYPFEFIRSESSQKDARVAIPIPQTSGLEAFLFYRRFRTNDTYSRISMRPEGETIVGDLPKQPAAGKLEYFIEINQNGKHYRIPGDTEPVVIRFKDPVPAFFLVPHILLMFFSILLGMRAGLGALFMPESLRRWTWFTLAGLTLGGMILGPVVQKYAFGAFWTGFPFGGDLTDNKTLIMWLAWITAALFLVFKPGKRQRAGRTAVFLAAVVMMLVYLIPHSMRGSELDYSKIDQGLDPREAVITGKRKE